MGGERPDPLLPLLPFPGWMHAGYPIMCHLESVQELINEKLIRTKGLWGPVHELGRNQQRQDQPGALSYSQGGDKDLPFPLHPG